VLADNFGSLVEMSRNTMKDGVMPSGIGLVFTYAFAFQIYCDFAAYSTIARGVAQLFGVELMRNFLTPYFSVNPSEFWTRWHISLSTWLRDYLYIPLGGNQHGQLMTFRNLMITMFLGGLWHGAGIFFIVWGVYHGLLLVLYRLFPIDRQLTQWFGFLGKPLSMLLFFHLVCLGWIFFRATPAEFLPIVKSIADLPFAIVRAFTGEAGIVNTMATNQVEALSTIANYGKLLPGPLGQFLTFNPVFAAYGWGLVLFTIPLACADYLGWRFGCEFPDLFERMPWPVRTILIAALFYGILFLARREANEFIYFAF
jgi:alginate O-acetyltransferase complex protein AlgI